MLVLFVALCTSQIYDLETTYLEETKEFGNIFTGWDSYTSAEKVKQRKNVLLEDRQFSLSSVTSPASRKEVNKKVSFTKIIGSIQNSVPHQHHTI